jgi:lipopolysaccharide/colanic/teichoic acid biosynthesis glycosyltransferase
MKQLLCITDHNNFPAYDQVPFMKRLSDLMLASAALVMICPLLLFVAFLIKLEDGGPAFYRGLRVGRFGKIFRLFKFRTMVVDAELIGGPSTAEDDPRITRIGRTLRKYKLDELPELLNVIAGDMSLVGPRPEVKSEVDS